MLGHCKAVSGQISTQAAQCPPCILLIEFETLSQMNVPGIMNGTVIRNDQIEAVRMTKKEAHREFPGRFTGPDQATNWPYNFSPLPPPAPR
jgi:hypothetical protein